MSSRSDDKSKGINKISLLEYARLPGILGERFFKVLDLNGDGYLDYREFLTGLIRVYCSNFDGKIKLVFDIYDFDHDGYISKEDIATILSYMPVVNDNKMLTEGSFTREGGNAASYNDKLDSLSEIYGVLNLLFKENTRLDSD